jgi:hypothetical protein
MLTCNRICNATTFGHNSLRFCLRCERMMQMKLAECLSHRRVEQLVFKMESKFNLMTRRQVHFLEFQVKYTISRLVT